MNAPIVIGLPPEDVGFLRVVLADAATEARREAKRARARAGSDDTAKFVAKWSDWRCASARRILAEIERQERACRKVLREGAA